jgi:hypothetical protein
MATKADDTATKADDTATRTSTDPNAPTEGVHPTWEEAQARIEDEIAAYRDEKEEEEKVAHATPAPSVSREPTSSEKKSEKS